MRRLTRFLIVVLALTAVALIALYLSRLPHPNNNLLALGPEARTAAIDIPIVEPIELDWLSRAEVEALRAQAVRAFPTLLAADYRPSYEVFGQVVDGRPWWGMVGQWYYGSGERSIEGVSEEARFIMNPYLLVAAEFIGFSHFYLRDFEWNLSGVDDPGDLPLMCAPERLHIDPANRAGEAHYDITGCMAAMNAHLHTPVTLDDAWFALQPYNARDFNLNYLYVDGEPSFGVEHDQGAPTDAVSLPHLIHLGGSCQYPGGCNNMSPAHPPTDNWRLNELPAQMTVKLWRAAPNAPAQPADLSFTLFFN